MILFYVFALFTTWATSLGLSMSWICSVFLTFYDVCGLSRWHSILPPTQAHHILTCVSMCTWKNITPLPTCMDAHCSSGIWMKSCLKWFLTSWQYFVLIRRFTFLVCHLMKLEIWPGVLFALWPNFKILCMTIIFSFVFGAKRINSTLSWSTSWTRWLRTFFLNND
jgi:hypothetical protein